ncbi:hypothetical protein B0H13DRAFT_502173 [Mycena leptocephala]|nr:hypothetical protein B0H13DRAFT_502173 [Mycena leptocephala]
MFSSVPFCLVNIVLLLSSPYRPLHLLSLSSHAYSSSHYTQLSFLQSPPHNFKSTPIIFLCFKRILVDSFGDWHLDTGIRAIITIHHTSTFPSLQLQGDRQ